MGNEPDYANPFAGVDLENPPEEEEYPVLEDGEHKLKLVNVKPKISSKGNVALNFQFRVEEGGKVFTVFYPMWETAKEKPPHVKHNEWRLLKGLGVPKEALKKETLNEVAEAIVDACGGNEINATTKQETYNDKVTAKVKKFLED